MKKVIVRFLLLSVAILFAAAILAQEHLHQKFEPEQFEKPERATWQKPDEVVARLNLKQGNVVADIGAGSGYFTRRFAKAVGSKGIVYAVDIDENMLRYIQQRAEKENQHNIVTVLCPENDPMLAPQSVDLIFICDTIHHIANRSDYYERIKRCLRPGGRLVIVDYYKKELPLGPPMHLKIAKETMIQEITNSGFALSEDFDLLPYQYYLVFRFQRPS